MVKIRGNPFLYAVNDASISIKITPDYPPELPLGVLFFVVGRPAPDII